MNEKNLKLRDTMELMNSSDYKDRFCAEYAQTKIRYEKLKAFNNKIEAARRVLSNPFECRPKDIVEPKHDCPEDLLRDQQSVMGQYLHILEVMAEIEGIDLDGALAYMSHSGETCGKKLAVSSKIIENIPKENGVSEMKKVY